MCRFSSPRWTRCLQVSCMALVVSVTLASFQLLSQAQGAYSLAPRLPAPLRKL